MKINDSLGHYNPNLIGGAANVDFSELHKLARLLEEEGIPFCYNFGRPKAKFQVDFFGQIEYLDFHDERISDAAIVYSLSGSPVSYGAPLLEIMGLTENGDEVEGGLTAEEVFKRWKNDFEKRKGVSR